MDGLGPRFGESWEGLGRGLGPHGLSWAVFWSFFLLIWDPRVSKRAQELPKRSLELDLGVVWEGLGKVLGRFWEGFGWVWKGLKASWSLGSFL